MTLARLETYPEIERWHGSVDRWFGGFFRPVRRTAFTGRLGLDAYETPEELVVQADLPGANPKDVDITIENRRLTIRAHREQHEEDKDARWVTQELDRGEYARSVLLPETVDGDRANASFEHGVLTLRIPKRETAKPRRIKVEATGK